MHSATHWTRHPVTRKWTTRKGHSCRPTASKEFGRTDVAKTCSGIHQPEPVPWRRIVVETVARAWGTWGTRSTRGTRGTGTRSAILTWFIRRSVLRAGRLDHCLGDTLFLGIGSGSLMRWPWPRHRLPSDPKPVDNLWPSKDRRALPGLRGVLDQLEDAGVAPAMSGRFDRHRLAPLWLRCRLLVGSLAAASTYSWHASR